nr:MAG TPA: hypothetical protein [Caudoviricetes sp.]
MSPSDRHQGIGDCLRCLSLYFLKSPVRLCTIPIRQRYSLAS